MWKAPQKWVGSVQLVVMVLGVLFVASAANQNVRAENDKPAAFDAGKLVGDWTYTSAQKNGENVDADKLKGQTATITKETFTLKGEATFVMTYTLDTKKSPVTVKFTITESPFGPGAKADGIIEVNEDVLKVCYAPMGGDAPTKFEAKQGSNHFFFQLKRKK